MIKIFLTVRNRLAITKKCIEAIQKHSSVPRQIYVYDNHSTYMVDEHFKYFSKLYRDRIITQISFTSEDSTFKAFSKASACNFFGKQHEEDPQKDSYDFLLFLDNDVILTPGWDIKLQHAWRFVRKNNLPNVKVIGQLPGGIKGIEKVFEIDGIKAKIGKLGGSGLWSVKPNFFSDVGFLELKQLVGHDKRHDQLYWRKIERATNGDPYIMGLGYKLGIHCGKYAGSVCNRLVRNASNPKKLSMICFEEAEKKIDSMDFDSFYKMIVEDTSILREW